MNLTPEKLRDGLIGNPEYVAWLEEKKRAWDFYQGAQWTPEEEKRIQEQRHDPVTGLGFNKEGK